MKLIEAERHKRAAEIGGTIREALGEYVVSRRAEEVAIREVSTEQLASLLLRNPSMLKPLIAACNMGKRALRKDLGVELDTYRPRLTPETAREIAEYLRPSLPKAILIESLIALDASQWVDSAIRKAKGRWERQFGDRLRKFGLDCKKRKFSIGGQEFELDLAAPTEGDVLLGVDIKMIGHPSDKHKRGDEIVNKATKFKGVVPTGRFLALIYYPFDEDRESLRERLLLGASYIDEVIFAGDDEESIAAAVDKLAYHWRGVLGGDPKPENLF